jgi:hypothetical protein
MALSALIDLALRTTLTGAPTELSSASSPVNVTANFNWADGSGANQASFVFADTRQIAASSNDDLDLAGILTDALGNVITFTKIRAILVKAAAGNTNNVLIGGAGAADFLTWVGDATDIVVVRPGGMFLLVAPDATGYVVTVTTADILRIANSAGGSVVDYDIVLIGA